MTIPIRTFIPTEADRMEEAEEQAWEALRAECEREFDEWRGFDWQGREHADFSDWLVRMAQPHMRDAAKYAAAMDWRERSRVDLVALSKGQHAFKRQSDPLPINRGVK